MTKCLHCRKRLPAIEPVLRAARVKAGVALMSWVETGRDADLVTPTREVIKDLDLALLQLAGFCCDKCVQARASSTPKRKEPSHAAG